MFRVELKPLIDGANPYTENKYKSILIDLGKDGIVGVLNERAVLQETVHLYEGDAISTRLVDTPIQARGFVEIRTAFFTDNELVFQAQTYWGLKDATSGEDITGYVESATDVDPIHIFRTTKVLEGMPHLESSHFQYFDDFCSASIASQRSFYSFQLRDAGKEEIRWKIEHRRKVAEIIGRRRLRDILQMVSPHLEEMIQTMRERRISVVSRELEREIRLKRIIPSEFCLDMVTRWHDEIESFAKGMDEAGGVW